VVSAAKELNSDVFKFGDLHEKHAAATLKLGNHLSVRLKTGENHGNLCQDPNAPRLLVIRSKNEFGRFPNISPTYSCMLLLY
jgi:hypothetical protein